MDDEPELGFIAFMLHGNRCFYDTNRHPFARIPLRYYDDIKMSKRSRFDIDFAEQFEQICTTAGQPVTKNRIVLAHNDPPLFYRYAVWQLQHCRLALLQDEFDILDGHDLSLQYLYGEGAVQELLYGEIG